jgi:NAD(P)-dependent dehydrogenase (short-subunit alcohol dehydrogenase family)
MRPIILITGGSRGIGAATSLLAAQKGYNVVVNYRSDDEAASRILKRIHDAGGEAIAHRADLSNEEEIMAMFRRVDNELGPLSALVNNAGILGRQCSVDEIDWQRLQTTFAVNTFAPFICAREAVLRMAYKFGGKGGAIVNVSSTAIRQGGPFTYVDYAASKGALEVFTIGLAKEVAGEGIRVNAVRPGIVDTGIHASSGAPNRLSQSLPSIPMKRGGMPEEVARAIMWLISEDASYSAGAILDVSGGR